MSLWTLNYINTTYVFHTLLCGDVLEMIHVNWGDVNSGRWIDTVHCFFQMRPLQLRVCQGKMTESSMYFRRSMPRVQVQQHTDERFILTNIFLQREVPIKSLKTRESRSKLLL